MKNQQFYVKTARLAVPIMMQNMITIGVNMADNIMVGSLGENALSAVALANQFINIYQFSCMGLGQGASIMTSRFWGMKNEKALKQTIAITTRICLVLGILFTVITWCFPEIIMKIFICMYLIKKKKKIGFRIHDIFMKCQNLMKEYVQISIPVVISDTLYGFGNSAVSMVMGRIGSQFVSANSITLVTQQLSTVFIQGAAQSSSVVVGNTLGEGNVARAKEEAERFMKMGIILGALSTIIIILISDPVISCYNITPETAVIAKELMYSIGIIMLFRGVNSMMTKGVLRGGGDTRFLMVADILFLWVASVPLGYLAGVVLHWPAFWTYFFLKIDEIIKCFWCVWRLKSGKWIKKISG